MNHLRIAIAAYVICAAPERAWSQAFVEHLSPPVLQRGALNRMQVFGTDIQDPVGLWTSLPTGKVTVRSMKSMDDRVVSLEVEISPDAPLGIYGLRLGTTSGLSNVHLFAVDELPVTTRSPDLAGDRVVPVSLPATITAVCRPATVDRYSITVAKGQRVAFEVIGNRLGKDYDPLVQIRSANHKLVAEFDNSVGLMFDVRFAHQFDEAGTYTVEVRDARFDGNPAWNYGLRMGDFPAARSAVPSAVKIGETGVLQLPHEPGMTVPVSTAANAVPADLFQEIRLHSSGAATWIPITLTDLPTMIESKSNDSKETATLVSVPGTLNGCFEKPGDRDWYAFELAKDQKLVFQGVSRTIGGAADVELVLFDADNREVRRVDDNELEEGSFAFNVGKAGQHRLQVREQSRDGGPDYVYRIDVRAGGPQIELLVEFPEVSVPHGTYQAFPIKVTRTEFSGEIALELLGAPSGITLEPDVIPAGAVEFVGRMIAPADMPEGIHTFQVIGKGTLPDGSVIQGIARTKPVIDRYLKNVDLIPYGLREDQRHLPPSLANRIALMVIPPSPYTAELPEPLVQLTRFQTAEFPIATTRIAGFAEPIHFNVKGGQIGAEREERNQVYARFKPATPELTTTSGTFFNRINTQLNKHRVDLTATATCDGRRINLVRCFTLNVQAAFRPTFDPDVSVVEPGGTARCKILANRVATFNGPVNLTFSPMSGFVVPATATIPAGQPSIDLEILVDGKQNPGRYNIRVEAAGFVGKYEESLNASNLQIEVKKPTP